MKKFISHYKWLMLAVLVAVFLRVVDIGNTPRALYGDELTMVYDSYSLVKNGTDQLANPWPITFQMGAGRPAGYVYGSIPFVYIFGPGVAGIRSLSIIAGVALVLIVFFIGSQLFDKQVGLVAAWLLAISPWGISLSRGGFEANFGLFLASMGVLFLLQVKKNIWFILGWVLCWGIAINTYPTFKLVLPIFGLGLLYYLEFWRYINFKNSIVLAVSALLCLMFVSMVGWQLLYSGSENRFFSINIFSVENISKEITNNVKLNRTQSGVSDNLKPILFNKYWEYGNILLKSYLENFSWNFLFIKGDGNPRHNPAEQGGFYKIEILTIFVGLLGLFSQKRKVFYVLVFWVLSSPLATTLLGTTHFLRSCFMLIPIVLISSYGFITLFSIKTVYGVLIKLLIIGGLILGLISFLVNLFFISGEKTQSFWSYAAKVASEMVVRDKQQYKYVVLSDRIDNLEFAYPVYGKIDPKIIIQENLRKSELFGYNFKKFDNVYIGKMPWSDSEKLLKQLNGSILFIGSLSEKENFKEFQIVNDNNGRELFIVKSYK